MKIRIVTLLLLTLTSCQYLFQLKPDKSLQEKVENELKANSEVNFAEITDFDWDQMIFLRPYAQVEMVEDSLNLDLRNIRQNGIEDTDFHSFVVFLKERKSVKIMELSRGYDYPTELIDRKKSLFRIKDRRSLELAD